MAEEKKLETIGDYWSMRSEGFSEYMLAHLAETEQDLHFRRIYDFIGDRKLKVLDIGCGPGMFSIALGKKGQDVTAIDYSDGMIAKAKQNCEEAGVPANIMKMIPIIAAIGASVTGLKKLSHESPLVLRSRSRIIWPVTVVPTLDLIVSRKVVWNLEDPAAAYGEWLRVLKPEGKIMLFDANYFLYMHDEEYEQANAAMKAQMAPKTPEVARSMQGADPNILWGFAKEL
ncbi:MAG: class I SAM-dependent methyltransferase, partial [archaeon]|nr:class I SAM-dependent methyltransferase [archaeon]